MFTTALPDNPNRDLRIISVSAIIKRMLRYVGTNDHFALGLSEARATTMEIFEGPPEFTDLTVIDDWSL
jgi:hypothetical protein